METQVTLLKRQSCRAFTKKQISDEELNILLQAANSAPVSMENYDDVELCIIQNKEMIAEIEQTVASVMPAMGEHPAYEAPTIILINGKKENAEQAPLAWCNASCIAENIMLSATDLGLGSVYLYAVPFVLSQVSSIYEKLSIRDGFFPVVAVAIGNPQQEMNIRETSTDKINKKIFL